MSHQPPAHDDPHHQPDDHGGDHGHQDNAHGEAHGGEALGPIDISAWAAAIFGSVLGFAIALAFVAARS